MNPIAYFPSGQLTQGTETVTIDIDAPVTCKIFQRDDNGMTSIVVNGTYSGDTPDHIQVSAITRTGFSGHDVPFTNFAFAGGNFSGVLSVRSGWYDITVRAIIGKQIRGSTSVTKIGVGENWIIVGQSLGANYGSATQTPADERVCHTDLDGLWALAADPQPVANGAGGSPWPAFGDLLASYIDCPVGILDVCIGGTAVLDWAPGSTNYNTNLKPALQFFGYQGCRGVLWIQGESDSIIVKLQVDYHDDLIDIIDESRIDAGWPILWGIPNTETYNESGGLGTMLSQAAVQAAQTDVGANYTGCWQGPNTDDIISSTYRQDGVHMKVAGLTAQGQRWAANVKAHFGW